MRTTLLLAIVTCSFAARNEVQPPHVPKVPMPTDVYGWLTSESWASAARAAAWAVRTGVVTAMCDAAFPRGAARTKLNTTGDAAFGPGSPEARWSALAASALAVADAHDAHWATAPDPDADADMPRLAAAPGRAAVTSLLHFAKEAVATVQPWVEGGQAFLGALERLSAQDGKQVLPLTGAAMGTFLAGVYTAADSCTGRAGSAAEPLMAEASLARTVASIHVIANALPSLLLDIDACSSRASLLAQVPDALNPTRAGSVGCQDLHVEAVEATQAMRDLTTRIAGLGMQFMSMAGRFSLLPDHGPQSFNGLDAVAGQTFAGVLGLPTDFTQEWADGIDASGRKLKAALERCGLIDTVDTPTASVLGDITTALSLAEHLDSSRRVTYRLSESLSSPFLTLAVGCRPANPVNLEPGQYADDHALEALPALLRTSMETVRMMLAGAAHIRPTDDGSGQTVEARKQARVDAAARARTSPAGLPGQGGPGRAHIIHMHPGQATVEEGPGQGHMQDEGQFPAVNSQGAGQGEEDSADGTGGLDAAFPALHQLLAPSLSHVPKAVDGAFNDAPLHTEVPGRDAAAASLARLMGWPAPSAQTRAADSEALSGRNGLGHASDEL